MYAHRLYTPQSIIRSPLVLEDIPPRRPGHREVLLKVNACGICHTDLHIVEGDLHLPTLPLTPGHQIIGAIEAVGVGVTKYRVGDRVGVPWLYSVCGRCEYCQSAKENLCDRAEFTGYHVDGGYAEHATLHEDACYSIDPAFSDTQAAPLLCAGVIGFRALRLCGIQAGQSVGLYGFGASAHIAIQILKHWMCEVHVFTRAQQHRELAVELGASWAGDAHSALPKHLDSSIIFAPAGELVPAALKGLKKGGILALAGIHMSPIPEMEYKLLYEERVVRSVANSTKADVRELLDIAAQIQLKTEVETFPLHEANLALQKLKRSDIRGSGVLLAGI